MAKLLGSDIVTTSELETFSKKVKDDLAEFSEDVYGDIKVRADISDAQARNFKWACIIISVVFIVNLGLTVYLLVR